MLPYFKQNTFTLTETSDRRWTDHCVLPLEALKSDTKPVISRQPAVSFILTIVWLVMDKATCPPSWMVTPHFYLPQPASLHVSGCRFCISKHPPSMKTLMPTPLASPVSTSLTTTLFADTIPQPQPLGSSSRQANWLSPRRRGSCHISKLASPPPDKSYIPPSFSPSFL